MPEKTDLNEVFKTDYVAPKKPVLLNIRSSRYLAIDGCGAPGGPEFQARIGALYAMAYTVKMTRKFGGEQDYAIGKLEALWPADSEQSFSTAPPESWHWKLLIRTPEFVKKIELSKALAALRRRGRAPEAADVKLETIREGRCVQMLHVGPYDREGETVAVMKSFAESQGLTLQGPHHEIYISDPRRVPPEKLKTILRVPVR